MSTPRLSLRKKILFSFTVFAICLLAAFLVAEAIVRLAWPNVDLMALTGRKKSGASSMAQWAYVDAFSAFRAQPGEYRGKTVNSHGFMSTPELDREKPPGTIRIAFLGGSATAGTGLRADESTWPWRTTALLRQRLPGRQIEFINGALPGYSTFESYGRLWSRLRFFDPNIVVVYQGWNEMYYFNRVGTITRWRTLSDGSWSLDRGRAIVTYAPLWIDRVIWPSQILSKARLRLTEPLAGEVGPTGEEASSSPDEHQQLALRMPVQLASVGLPLGLILADGAGDQTARIEATEPKTELTDSFDLAGLEIFRDNLALIREAAKLFGWELFVAKQATLIVPGLSEELRQRCHYDFHGFGHDAHVRAFAEIYRVIDEEVAPEQVINTTRLSGRSELFLDHVHPTAEGAKAIAEIVADALSERAAALRD